MKKYFYIISLFLGLSHYAEAAAAGEGSEFLKGYKAEEVNRANVFYFFHPFSTSLVGDTEYEEGKGPRGVGHAGLAIEIGDPKHKTLWQERLDESVARLTTEDFQYPIPAGEGAPDTVLRLIHHVNAWDITTAKVLYGIAYRKGARACTTYERLESVISAELLAVWPGMKKEETALWTFLMAMKQKVWPIDPTTGSPSNNVDLLVALFKDFIVAYQAA